MLDNVADVLLMVGLLAAKFGFPTNVALRYMIPGTAIGVFVGDLLFFMLAWRLAKRTGRDDVTAMPLGLDTPSTFGMVFFVLGPHFSNTLTGLKEIAAKQAGVGASELASSVVEELTTKAAIETWHIGICAILASGIFKLCCAFGSTWIRATIPRAGLLGSLAAIAAVVISFLPLLEIFHAPVVGLVSLAIILTTLVAKVRLPWNMPGALGALLVGGTMYWIMEAGGWIAFPEQSSLTELKHHWSEATAGLLPSEWRSVFSFQWVEAWGNSLNYLPIVIPFALATVVGGIDCTESAAVVGDEYHTGQVIGVEAIATIVAALCGGVIQTTPYIGHPAYKAMGGRAAYTLATALFIGAAGIIGYFGFLYIIIPKPTVFPILVFVGLEITAQSFYATPKRHYTAVGLSLVPALAALVSIAAGGFGIHGGNVSPEGKADYLTVQMLYNGFIVTSLVWASALAYLIDHRLRHAAAYFAIAAAFTLCGVIHSPLSGGSLYLPWDLGSEHKDLAPIVYRWAAGYGLVAALLLAWDGWLKPSPEICPAE
jgi:AGZA family xanthine/uracil permease-like MFS transporter